MPCIRLKRFLTISRHAPRATLFQKRALALCPTLCTALRRTTVGTDVVIGPRDAVVCVPYRRLTEARCPEAFPVMQKIHGRIRGFLYFDPIFLAPVSRVRQIRRYIQIRRRRRGRCRAPGCPFPPGGQRRRPCAGRARNTFSIHTRRGRWSRPDCRSMRR